MEVNTNTIPEIEEAIKPKFRQQKRIIPTSAPIYPYSAEREYKRISAGCVKLLNKELKEQLPYIMSAYKQVLRKDSRYDDGVELVERMRKVFLKVAEAVNKKYTEYKIEKMVEKTGLMTRLHAAKEFSKTVKEALDIDLPDDYFEDDTYEEITSKWVSENVLKIRNLPNSVLEQMRQAIMDGWRNYTPVGKLKLQLQGIYNRAKFSASSSARAEISYLNGQLAQQEQEDAGIKRYKWLTCHDEKVRPCHRALDGKIFYWDNPPEMWYDRKAGRVYTGRYCHPGQDYGCRCVAIPVFEPEMLKTPSKWGKLWKISKESRRTLSTRMKS